jgi:predicted nucleic acid-binding protein
LIADTSFLIDLMMKESGAVAKAREIEGKGSTISVASPSVFELYVGVALSRKPEDEKARIMDLIGSLPQLPLDFESARAAGAIYGGRIREGVKIDPEDAMIAGIAKVRNEYVITRNARHFSGIGGVKVEIY